MRWLLIVVLFALTAYNYLDPVGSHMRDFQEWARTVVLAIAAVAPYIAVYTLTNRKEAAAKKKIEERGQKAPTDYLENVLRLRTEAADLNGGQTADILRELSSELKALSEFGEYSRDDVYTHSGTEGFISFGHLRRIGYHFRDEAAKLYEEYNGKPHDKKNLSTLEWEIKQLAADIGFRIDAFKTSQQAK